MSCEHDVVFEVVLCATTADVLGGAGELPVCPGQRRPRWRQRSRSSSGRRRRPSLRARHRDALNKHQFGQTRSTFGVELIEVVDDSSDDSAVWLWFIRAT